MSANFVPVGVNVFKLRDAKGAAGDLFRSINTQKVQYQGLWVVSPEGTVLAAYCGPEGNTPAIQETLNAGLRAFGPVEPRHAKRVEPLPYRGCGVHPDGNVSLQAHTCFIRDGKRVQTPLPDSLTLTAAEWAGFRPPAEAEGTAWAVPGGVARKFVRFLTHLDQNTMPHPEDATRAELKAVIESSDGTTCRVRLVGSWDATWSPPYLSGEPNVKKLTASASGTAEGLMIYDAEHQSPRSLLLVIDGALRYAEPNATPKVEITGALIEWRAAGRTK